MYLATMTHRDELFDLTLRWLNDNFNPEDGKAVTRIFLYESAVSAVVVERMIALLAKLFKGPLQVERIHQKQMLRKCIIRHLPRQSLRTRQLIQNFRENPDYYFPHLPVDAALITTLDSRLAAIGRIKRLTRVAEKVSFRLADALYREIQAEARQIAGKRATASGVPLYGLVSSESEMQNDFTAAETVVAGRFRSRNVRIAREAMTVNDLLGFKIVGEPELIEQAPAALQAAPGITLVEVEKHSGDYNAVNLLVDVELPTPDALAAQMKGFDWSIARRRGLDPCKAQVEFERYLAAGARSVRLEIILTTYDELMESEFGRSMHELRVLRLRSRQAYSGPIAQNASYLIEYLLALASSPTVDVSELPIKMYGRYLPETVVSAKCALFGNEIDGGFLNAFCMKPDCQGRFCCAADLAADITANSDPKEARYHY